MNKYELLETIGEGAYGVVIKARCRESGQLVAIKRFKESDEDELVRKTTLREVKILRSLKEETYVVKLLEAFRRKGRLYLVFEYVGKNLLELLEEHANGIPEPQLRRMVLSMLLSVHACHNNGVIHRDIKPENLLVNTDNTLRLCDFGFARNYTPGAKDLTDYVATRWYRSPELLLGTTDYSLPSDLFAAGCIMAELVDGQPLFPGESEIDQMHLIQKMLGPFTPQQQEAFSRNRSFAGQQLYPGPVETTLERKFSHRLSKPGLHLLKSLLSVDPAKRLTVIEALHHPYFEGLIEELCPQVPPLPTEGKSHTPTPDQRPSTRGAGDGGRRRSASKQSVGSHDASEAMPSIVSRPQSSGLTTQDPLGPTANIRNMGASRAAPTTSTPTYNAPQHSFGAVHRTGSGQRRNQAPLPKPARPPTDPLDQTEAPLSQPLYQAPNRQQPQGSLPRLHGLPPSGNGPAPPHGGVYPTAYNPFLTQSNRRGPSMPPQGGVGPRYM